MKAKKTWIVLLLLWSAELLSAEHETERRLGDALLVAMPLATMGSSYYLHDYEGMGEYTSSLIVTAAATEGLKKTTQKERPDNSDNLSFPSAHTSLSFSTATYIHKRYGFQRAIAPYLVASFIGYSRVVSKQHYAEDVIAGAVLGSTSSWYLVSENHAMRVTPFGGREYLGVEFQVDF